MNKEYENFPCYVQNKYVAENAFFEMTPEDAELPRFDDIKSELPQPIWDEHEDSIDCYYKAWEIAFSNLRKPTNENGFVSNYIDAAFNGCIFMWDSVFMLMFGKYAGKVFNFQNTLNNFYAKQHKDGFICRQISEETGNDVFTRFNPASTGPNVMAWCEWRYYNFSGDRNRLARVFPVLLAYHNWLKEYRTWPGGGYWSSGWGCGMDNMPRLQEGYSTEFSHGHQIWADTTLQQLLNAKTLLQIAKICKRELDTHKLEAEIATLTDLVEHKLWDESTAYYYDLWQNGEHNMVKSIGAYWALLAETVPENKLERFTAHLGNETEFKQPHRVPTLSADHPLYCGEGGNYWRGGVWSPTNYMVLKGLEKVGFDALAYEIACNHVQNVTAVYKETGTLWENYSPGTVSPGNMARSNFVGWSGISAISVLIENVLGIAVDAANKTLTWTINRTERNGIRKLPFGENGYVDLICEKRNSPEEEPVISVAGNTDAKIKIRWSGGKKTIHLKSKPETL